MQCFKTRDERSIAAADVEGPFSKRDQIRAVLSPELKVTLDIQRVNGLTKKPLRRNCINLDNECMIKMEKLAHKRTL